MSKSEKRAAEKAWMDRALVAEARVAALEDGMRSAVQQVRSALTLSVAGGFAASERAFGEWIDGATALLSPPAAATPAPDLRGQADVPLDFTCSTCKRPLHGDDDCEVGYPGDPRTLIAPASPAPQTAEQGTGEEPDPGPGIPALCEVYGIPFRPTEIVSDSSVPPPPSASPDRKEQP